MLPSWTITEEMKLIINPIFVVPSAIPTMPLSLRRFGKENHHGLCDYGSSDVICYTRAKLEYIYQNSASQNTFMLKPSSVYIFLQPN